METQTTVGKLTVKRRTATGKGVARKLRNNGLIPAVLYGANKESVSLTVSPTALAGCLDPGKRHNTVIALTLTSDDGAGAETVDAMLKDYQIHPLRRVVTHADFIRITAETRVHVSIPLLVEGNSPGVKLGGVLHQVFRELNVECKPADIPVSITTNIGALEVGDAIHVSDLTLTEGVVVLLPPTQTIVQIVSPRVGDAATATQTEGEEAVDAAAPAAEKKA